MVDVHLRRAGELVDRYVELLGAYAPVEATRLGLEGHDHRLPDLTRANLDAFGRAVSKLRSDTAAALAAIGPPATDDDREAVGDLELLADELEYRHFLLEVRPRYETDPLAVLELVSLGLHELLQPGDDDLDTCRHRMAAAVERARGVPVLLEQAGSLLRSSPAPHLDVAWQRLPGLVALVEDELPKRVADLGGDVTAARDAGHLAAESLTAYQAFLHELSEEPPVDWRLGTDAHAVTLRAALGTSMDPSAIEQRAYAWLDTIRDELAELSAQTWARRFPGEAVPEQVGERIGRTLTAVAGTGTRGGDLVAEARRAIDEARAFTLDSGLVDVPPAARLRVRPVPAYLRGVAVAFITQPPPLRPDAGCTYYLSPVSDHWPPEQVRSFLREYNPAQLRSLAIHEGYPGHFVQLEHAAQHPRLARRLLARPVFAEGWAVYIEREVLAAGFGAGETSAVAAEDYRLTQRKLELRIATNALLDIGLHTGSLDDAAALDLLGRAAFQEQAEARGKLVRAKITSGQLCSYFVGGEEVQGLRQEMEAHEGADFDVRAFHQRLLSHGTPTVPIAAAALRADAPSRRPFPGDGVPA